MNSRFKIGKDSNSMFSMILRFLSIFYLS